MREGRLHCNSCVVPDVQAIFLRRRHQPRRPPLAKIRPGSPAPTTGPGTAEKVTKPLRSMLVPAMSREPSIGVGSRPSIANVYMRPEVRIEFEKKASVITPEVTVKALTVEGGPGNVNGVIKLKADGAESMMISVAGWRDVLSCRP